MSFFEMHYFQMMMMMMMMIIIIIIIIIITLQRFNSVLLHDSFDSDVPVM